MLEVGLVDVTVLPGVDARAVLLVGHEAAAERIAALEEVEAAPLLEAAPEVALVRVARREAHLAHPLLQALRPLPLVHAPVAVPRAAHPDELHEAGLVDRGQAPITALAEAAHGALALLPQRLLELPRLALLSFLRRHLFRRGWEAAGEAAVAVDEGAKGR